MLLSIGRLTVTQLAILGKPLNPTRIMFSQRILALSFLIVEIIAIADAKVLPTSDLFRSHPLRFPLHPDYSATAADGDVDEDSECSLVVSRNGEILSSTQTETGHYKGITLTLTAFNETFILDLKLNTYLLASTYIEKAITKTGEVYNHVNHVMGHCYYTGEVRNRSRSRAAVSTCKGISGYFAIGKLSYHIKSMGDDLRGRHKVIRSREDAKTSFRCGTEDQLRWMSSNNSKRSSNHSSHRSKRSILYPEDEDGKSRVIEIYVANDHSQFRWYLANVDDIYWRTKDIVNTASLDYQPLGIYLALVGVEIWFDGDPFDVTYSNVTEVLNRWNTYRMTYINPIHYNDYGILITKVLFEGGVVGLTQNGGICSNRFSGSIVCDIPVFLPLAGTILAHELGHSFGLAHDEYFSPCDCNDPDADNRCIMSATTNPRRVSTKWSRCSLLHFTAAFADGMDLCLYNVPETIFQPTSSTCGNGIVENGEQCDCGRAASSECNSDCCDGNTCQLTATAKCSSGRCCDVSRCQIKSSGTQCRPQSNDCDLSESCNGVDALCPTDSYKPDGTDCTNIEAAYCYMGQCRSHRSQCELLWGPGTQVSDKFCYTFNNVYGLYFGNCGTNAAAEYIKCAPKDALCGRLQCQDFSRRLYYYSNLKTVAESRLYADSSQCHSTEFDVGIGTQDPGLVPQGAKCGDRQMCMNQKCIDVTLPSTTTSSSTRQKRITPPFTGKTPVPTTKITLKGQTGKTPTRPKPSTI